MRTRGEALCDDGTHLPQRACASEGEPARPGAPTRRGLLILYTGDGKGKTSAALGSLLRARGWKLRVAMYQFLKSGPFSGGEYRAARELGVEILPLGRGFTWDSSDLHDDQECARAGWRRCREALGDPAYDAVILDEITYPVSFGWLTAAEVMAAIRARPAHQHVILTGRSAPPEWIDAADLVTEMRCRKHPYRAGIAAQRGIEY